MRIPERLEGKSMEGGKNTREKPTTVQKTRRGRTQREKKKKKNSVTCLGYSVEATGNFALQIGTAYGSPMAAIQNTGNYYGAVQ